MKPLALFVLPALAFAMSMDACAAITYFDDASSRCQPRVRTMLEEAGSMEHSMSAYWWLNSGGEFFLGDSELSGKTIQGELPAFSKWRLAYAASNPLDTDNGYHPQNIFRLITRALWQNSEEQVYFQVTRTNESLSPQRGEWSGVFLLNRYRDGNNLYYAGLRADGFAVIKKKKDGIYYTMAYEPLFSNLQPYEQSAQASLLPLYRWIGIKTRVLNEQEGVRVQLFVDTGGGTWVKAAEAFDGGFEYGGPAHTPEGRGGIRSDFMDVRFQDFNAHHL